MKKYLIPFIFMFLLLPTAAYADMILTVNNYQYVHSNVAGSTQYLKNKTGGTVLHGDGREFNARIIAIGFEVEGMQNTTLYVISPDGSRRTVNNGLVNLPNKPENVQIAIDKTTHTETFVSVLYIEVEDDDLPGEVITYYFMDTPPTRFGDLAPDPGGGGGSFAVLWNAGTCRITFTTIPAGTYEVIVEHGGTSRAIVPTTGVYRVPDGFSGEVKLTAKMLDGTVLGTQRVNAVCAAPDPVDPDPPDNPDPVDPDPSDSCFCEPLCQILPDILDRFADNFTEIRDNLVDLNSAMHPIQHHLGNILDNTYTLHDDNLRQENLLGNINYHVAPLHDDLNEIIRQITPTRHYYRPALPSYTYTRPPQATPVFRDNTTYFTDPGSAEAPPPMPVAPEPKNWEHEGRRLNKDPIITPDPVMQQQPAMTRDSDMVLDQPMQLDPEMSKDAELQVEVQNYPLRWKSSDYQP